MRYYFDWDSIKENSNRRKHGISFDRAATIFHDAQSITIYDNEHSQQEERWITLGLDKNGVLLVVIHTFRQIDENSCNIRVISARKATSKETKQYQGGNS